MGEAAGGEAFRRRRIGTVPRAATRCSAKSSCTSAGVSRLGAEGCCSVAYQEDVAVGPGPAKPSERRQSPISAEAIPSDPKSLMKYCSQVLTTARVLLGWNPCSKGNDCGQRLEDRWQGGPAFSAELKACPLSFICGKRPRRAKHGRLSTSLECYSTIFQYESLRMTFPPQNS